MARPTARAGLALGATLLGAASATFSVPFSRPVALAALGLGVGTCAAAWLAWPFVRRWALAWLVFACVLRAYVAVSLVLPGFAVLVRVLDRGTAIWLAAASLIAALTQGAAYTRAAHAGWEACRRENEKEVLDLQAATYDVARGFQTRVRPRDAFGGSARSVALPAVMTVVTAATLSHSPGVLKAEVGSPRLLGRALVFAAITPGLAVALAHLLALGLAHVARLRGYERQLGRPVLNR